MSLDEAVNRAVDECIKEGILAEFLLRNKAEAVSMCIFEYDEEKEMEKYKRAESLYIREELEKELREELTEEIQLEVLKNLIQQGCIAVEDAAKQMETTVEEFRRMIDCQNSGSAAGPAEH